MKENVKIIVKILAVTILIAVVILSATSCIRIGGWGIAGSGNVISEERAVSSFDKVAISAGMNIYLEQGESEYLKIEAEDNILENIVTEVNNGKLVIKYRGIFHSISPKKPINVYLTVINLRELSASSGVIVESKEIKTDNIKVNISSGATGKMQITASTLDIGLSSGAQLTLSGTVESQNVNLSSGVQYQAANLISKYAVIRVSSGAIAKVNVSDNLDVNVSSGGTVEYSGNPSITSNISSGGSLKGID